MQRPENGDCPSLFFLRAQAELGGYAFLARTVVRSRVKRDGTGNNGYALERCGGMYNKVELRGRPCRQNGRRFVSEEVAPYLGYMRMLAVTPVDERLPVRIIRPAVKGLLPWLLDCSGLPLGPRRRRTSEALAAGQRHREPA